MTKKINEVEKDIFDDESTIPESNWFTFDKIGDAISGELIESFPKEGKFGMQQIYIIKTKEGEEFNVALKHTTHKLQVAQMKRALPGDTVGFRFAKEVDTDYGNKAKSIEVRIRPKMNGEL